MPLSMVPLLAWEAEDVVQVLESHRYDTGFDFLRFTEMTLLCLVETYHEIHTNIPDNCEIIVCHHIAYSAVAATSK